MQLILYFLKLDIYSFGEQGKTHSIIFTSQREEVFGHAALHLKKTQRG